MLPAREKEGGRAPSPASLILAVSCPFSADFRFRSFSIPSLFPMGTAFHFSLSFRFRYRFSSVATGRIVFSDVTEVRGFPPEGKWGTILQGAQRE